VSTVLASLIDAGGLGGLLFTGLRTNNLNMLLWATLLTAVLALVANGLLTLIERGFSQRDEQKSKN